MDRNVDARKARMVMLSPWYGGAKISIVSVVIVIDCSVQGHYHDKTATIECHGVFQYLFYLSNIAHWLCIIEGHDLLWKQQIYFPFL